MKVVSIVFQSIIILFRIFILILFSLLILSALESSFSVFPKTFAEILQAVPEIGFGNILSRYGKCILSDNRLIDQYCNFLILTMPIFYFQMVFFGFGYAFRFQWTIKEYRDGGIFDTYDGTLFVGLILLVVRIILAFLLLMVSPILLFILIILNIKKLVQTILD